jgi:hypothetical protein
MSEKLKESFNWLMPFKHMLDGVKHLIKGVAISIGRTKNDIPYTGDELLRSARTLTHKPLLINHLESVDEAAEYLATNGNKIPDLVRKAIENMVSTGNMHVGHVLDSEYEGDAVEYVAQVTDPATQAVVDAGLVKGVSIGAFPRIMSTPPQGILFADLSLITDPETPADPDATAEIMEKLREMLRPKPSLGAVLREQRRSVDVEMKRRVLMELLSRNPSYVK